MIVKNCTSLNAVWKALHLYYGIQSSDDTHRLPNSKTLHQSDEPSYQDYSMCKPARKSNHDIQQLPAKNKAFLKSIESKIQSFASDSHILRPDEESSLTNMNTLDISMLSQDCEQSVPDSPEMINLKCVVPNVLPQESRLKQFLSSDQKSNVLSSQNVPSSEHSFLKPLFKTSNYDNVQSTPLPSTRQETGSEKASLDEDDKPDLQSLQSPPPIEKVLYEQTNTKEQSKLKCATSRTTAKSIISFG